MQYLDDCACARICLINQIRSGDEKRPGRSATSLEGDRYLQRKAILSHPWGGCRNYAFPRRRCTASARC